ncbi:hypothetical protein [Flavobacterium silvaticum]|uniref:Uncharacterized protein n=1 Tax=Flavobacterium silvaticum TaxID=1852020 RepID=A0A972FS04_9FLAO|nr:hypothetical protein [Flavobacterium silvaticum]NMH26450.1 hypothetical protein [Flavobacterium silvaticum]
MKTYERSENQQKIIQGMNKVYENLLTYKKRLNSELVVLKDDKIVRVKP